MARWEIPGPKGRFVRNLPARMHRAAERNGNDASGEERRLDSSQALQRERLDRCRQICKERLLVVFDMDHTLVGDLVCLSDRDNLETNIDWEW